MIYHILGNGGFAQELAASIRSSKFQSGFDQILFYEDDNDLTAVQKLVNSYQNGEVLIGVGSPKLKEKWDKELDTLFINKNKHLRGMFAYVFAGHLAGTVIGHEDFSYEDSPIMCHGSIVTTNVRLGKFVTLNLNVTIGHDSSIGDYTTVHPGVNISGNVKIEKGCEIGSNVVIIPGVTLPDYGTVGAGSVVTKTPDLREVWHNYVRNKNCYANFDEEITSYMMAGNPAVVKKVNGVKVG